MVYLCNGQKAKIKVVCWKCGSSAGFDLFGVKAAAHQPLGVFSVKAKRKFISMRAPEKKDALLKSRLPPFPHIIGALLGRYKTFPLRYYDITHEGTQSIFLFTTRDSGFDFWLILRSYTLV